MSRASSIPRPQEHCNKIIRLLLEATVSRTGTAFFRSLVKAMAEALDTSVAWVTEYLPEENRLRALAMWAEGAFVDNYEYVITGTPCEKVVERCAVTHYQERLLEIFPGDADLGPLHAVSFIGAPLVDAHGRLIGHIAAIDKKPMPPGGPLIDVIRLFAQYATAEYLRGKSETALVSREKELRQLLETTFDAILVLDEDLRIQRVNQAAEAAFACTSEDLLGENLADFLDEPSCRRLQQLCRRLAGESSRENRVWIPEGMQVQRWDRSTFPADASLSIFSFEEGTRFTLILRNSDERGAATARIEELTRQTLLLRNAVDQAFDSAQLVGRCAGMQSLVQQIERVAQTDATVLIIGETGTGKELVAQHVHRKSRRRDRPLICVNCGAIPATLIESEFFGHEKGAFTGATERRIGKFERADGGTLFLDEIGELSPELQAKLLRVLQEGTLERLGGAKTITVDTRVVAATHRDLLTMVREGKFREDLYYRLNVFPLSIPPLRERGDDVCLLAEVLVERLGRKMGRRPDPLSKEDFQLLKSYHWPGNVRELQNVLERAMIQSRGPKLYLASAMPIDSRDSTVTRTAEIAQGILTASQLKALERTNLQRALAASDGRVFGEQGAARLLGLPPTTVASRMKALKIPRR